MSDSQSRIKTLVEENAVFLFMKGTPDMPQCGFSMRSTNAAAFECAVWVL